MTNLTPDARLKVKGDTFFLPVPNEGVYFRNNVGTFRMEGEMIDRWIEKLIPMFNGQYTLANLTDGLSSLHRDRVYEIADVLNQKGFVRDVSLDQPHQMREEIVQKYASQIAFLDSFGDSGAYRFQLYRQSGASLLAVGCGPFLVALVSALIESGLPKLHVWITDSEPTNRQRLTELADHARKTDPEVSIEEVTPLSGEGSVAWRDVIQPFQTIMFVSQEGNIGDLRSLHEICIEEKKMLIPAMCMHQVGMAGPLVHSDNAGCWESAWRRLHETAIYKDPMLHIFSSTAGAMLANVVVFEWFKSVTGAVEPEMRNSLFLLDLETMEGSWHPILPHPHISGWADGATEPVRDLDHRLEGSTDANATNRLFHFFSQLTSAQTGIFHVWEEGDLKQLPLSQCRVQPVDPLSEGPAMLLPEIIRSGLTHEEARREAGLAGMEAYVSRIAGVLIDPNERVGIGAGDTVVEGVVRGLQACLDKELMKQQSLRKPSVIQVQLGKVEDERCRYDLQALSAMKGTPSIGLGSNLYGFPVVWIGTGDGWYGSVGLNRTTAMRKSLQAALQRAQIPSVNCAMQAIEVSSVVLEKKVPLDHSIPALDGTALATILGDARQVLKKNGMHLMVLDMAVEPFLKEAPVSMFGVLLREGESW